MKRLTIALILLSLALAGCETFKGFGQDMQNAGNWVERTAERAK